MVTTVSWPESLVVSPAVACQLFYILASATVLAVAALPAAARQPLTQYGARGAGAAGAARKPEGGDVLVTLITWVTSAATIPHSWFTHFYVLSVYASVFWAIQYLRQGALMEFIIAQQDSGSGSQGSMSSSQVVLAWFLMALQGCRRLYECYAVSRPSSSRMLIFHWLLGAGFYLVTSIGIWVEGSSG